MTLLLAALLLLQDPQPKLGSIEGAVTRMGTNAPVDGASVILSASALGPSRTATTDGGGRFTITGVAPGRYVISAEKDGYLAASSGANIEKAAIATVRVDEDKRAQVAFRLVRTTKIRGQISDNDGKPKQGLSVELLRIGYNALGIATWVVRSGATTNERGEYAFEGLMPDDYYVRAGQLPWQNQFGVTGHAVVTYFPGTSEANAAAPVVVRVDDDEHVADFKVRVPQTFSVRGVVLNALPNTGDRIDFELKLAPHNSKPLGAPVLVRFPQNHDGRFEISGVPPGTYDVTAVAEVWRRGSNAMGRMTMTSTEYSSKVPIQVREADVDGVRITVKPGVEVRGRLIVEGDGQGIHVGGVPSFPAMMPTPVGETTTRVIGPLRAAENLLSVSLVRKDAESEPSSMYASNTEGTTFSAQNIHEGEYVVQTRNMPLGPFSTYVADIRSGARSILTDSFVVGADAVDLEVVVRSDGGAIEPELSASGDVPVLVVLVPSLQQRNNPARYTSITTRGSGVVRAFRGIAPGEYKLFAWEGAEGVSWSQPFMNPDYIAKYESRGVPVTIRPGTTTTGIKVVAIPIGE